MRKRRDKIILSKPIQNTPGQSISGVSLHLRGITHLRRILELELGTRQPGGIPGYPMHHRKRT
jgi:hypothetical protein